MGLLAAKHLGFQNIVVQAPNNPALLQVSHLNFRSQSPHQYLISSESPLHYLTYTAQHQSFQARWCALRNPAQHAHAVRANVTAESCLCSLIANTTSNIRGPDDSLTSGTHNLVTCSAFMLHNSACLLQALDVNAACSSQLAAYADAVLDVMGAFDELTTEVGDTADTWAAYRLASGVCRKRSRGVPPCCCPSVFQQLFLVQAQVDTVAYWTQIPSC